MIEEIADGPNMGVVYFGEETRLTVFGYYIVNSAAMTRGSRFYAAQDAGNRANRVGGVPWCPPSVVLNELPRTVEAHEQRHGAVYQAALVRESGSRIARLEALSGMDGRLLDRAYRSAWDEINQIASTESSALHEQPGGSVTGTFLGRPCALKNENGLPLENGQG